MQYKNKESLLFIKELGKVIAARRLEANKKSRLNFCNSYELDSSNLRRIEKGEIEPKITMLVRIAEALNTPLSQIIREVEDKLGKDFHLLEQ